MQPARGSAEALQQRPTAGRRLSGLVGPVARAVAALDTRLMRVASRPASDVERGGGRLELALMLHLRQGLAAYAEERSPGASGKGEERIDTVFAESVLEACDHVFAVLVDLDAGAARNFARCVAFVRAQAGALVALGANDPERQAGREYKKQLDMLRETSAKAAGGPTSAAFAALATLYLEVARKLDKASPRQVPSLLDQWLRPPPA